MILVARIESSGWGRSRKCAIHGLPVFCTASEIETVTVTFYHSEGFSAKALDSCADHKDRSSGEENGVVHIESVYDRFMRGQ